MDAVLLQVLEQLSAKKSLEIEMNAALGVDGEPPSAADYFVKCEVHPFNVYMEPHVSDGMEMMYVCRGRVCQIIGDIEIPLETGDILLTSPGTAHGIMPTTQNDLAINITVNPYFFDRVEDILPGQSVLSDFFENLRYQN